MDKALETLLTVSLRSFLHFVTTIFLRVLRFALSTHEIFYTLSLTLHLRAGIQTAGYDVPSTFGLFIEYKPSTPGFVRYRVARG